MSDEEAFRTSADFPPNGKPGWRDVLAAVERAEDRLAKDIEGNSRKIDDLQSYNLNHPVAVQPVEKPVVDALCKSVDDLEAKFDHVEGQVSAMKVISSTLAGVTVILLSALGLVAVFFP